MSPAVAVSGVTGKVVSSAQQQRAMAAIHAARRLWPPVIARVLEDEIMTTYEFLAWMGDKSRTVKLIDQILALDEAAGP